MQCGTCNKTIRYPAAKAGMTGKCPGCGDPVRLRDTAVATVPPHLPPVIIDAPPTRPRSSIGEYRRKCNMCGKIWHSLASREKQITKQENCSNCEVVANCCNPAAQIQAKRNQQASQSEYDRLRKCPECGSQNYSEELV